MLYACHLSHSRRCSTLTQIAGINSPHNTITCSGRQSTNAQGLNSSIYRTSLGTDRDPILDIAEAEEDNNGDGNGYEEGVGDVVKGEIWY